MRKHYNKHKIIVTVQYLHSYESKSIKNRLRRWDFDLYVSGFWNVMNRELYDEAIRSNILSRKLIEQLMESMNYSSISFINWTVEVLKIIKTRLERGDKITDEVSGITYDIKSFRNFVSTNFSSYITSQVFDAPDKAEKVYFSLEATEDGHAYNMVMANSSKDKTYKWISSLSERFSLVEMIATGIVYVKDTRTNTYQPFISGKGKYCKYDKEKGILVEI